MKEYIPTIAKAIAAAVAVFGTTFATAIILDSPGGSGVTASEWVAIVTATLVAGLTTWAVPNRTV